MLKRPSEKDRKAFLRMAAYISEQFAKGNKRPCDDVETAKALYSMTSNPVPEVLVVTEDYQKILLRLRTPETDPGIYHGWHIFGGFMQAHISTKDKVFEICKEDGGIEPSDITKIVGIIARRDWHGQHEYAHPVSELVIVVVPRKILEKIAEKRDDLELFDVADGIPKGMINSNGIHEELLEEYFAWVASPHRFAISVER